MKLSTEQQAIETTWKTSNKNILVNACPGSGKTTLAVHLMRVNPNTTGKTLAVAFNKSIATEMGARTKDIPGVMARTLHSIGFISIGRALPLLDIHVDGRKGILLAKNFLFAAAPYIRPYKSYPIAAALAAMYDAHRVRGLNNTDDILASVMGAGEEIPKAAKDLYEDYATQMDEYNRQTQGEFMIDFTDMIYLPKFRSEEIDLPKFDTVFLDEAQDASSLMQFIVNRSIKPDGRKVIVGDNDQSIYEFAGADPGSMHNFLSQPNFEDMPMNLSFRCSQAVVEQANKFKPDMVAFEGNPTGFAGYGSIIDDAQNGDMILCRNNAPLAKAFVALLSVGKAAQIKDADIMKTVDKIIAPAVKKGMTTFALMNAISDRKYEIQYQLKAMGEQDPETHPTYLNYCDTVDMVSTLLTLPGVYSPAHLQDKLKSIFSGNGQDGISLMSMHKSKGLEADRVFIIRRDLWPSKRAKTAVQLQQENNLMFVAITRAKNAIIFDDEFDTDPE